MVLKVQPESIGIGEEGVVWYGTVDHGVIEDLGNHVGKAVEKALLKRSSGWWVSEGQVWRRVVWEKVCLVAEICSAEGDREARGGRTSAGAMVNENWSVHSKQSRG